MKKALILCFFVDCEKYDCQDLNNMDDVERYYLAINGVDNGTADIYTIMARIASQTTLCFPTM